MSHALNGLMVDEMSHENEEIILGQNVMHGIVVRQTSIEMPSSDRASDGTRGALRHVGETRKD
jgi:hypothetical protein